MVKKLTNPYLIAAIILIVAALFYYVFDPAETSWMPGCVFHKLTGLQCMGCGAQRMVHALLHGNFREAWHSNAFLMLALPFLLVMTILELKRTRYPSLYARLHSNLTIITISALLLAWLILRNVFGI